MRKMYAIKFLKFSGHIAAPATLTTCTSSAVLLGLSTLLILRRSVRRSVRHIPFFEFCSIYFFFYICCYLCTSISILKYAKDGLYY